MKTELTAKNKIEVIDDNIYLNGTILLHRDEYSNSHINFNQERILELINEVEVRTRRNISNAISILFNK